MSPRRAALAAFAIAALALGAWWAWPDDARSVPQAAPKEVVADEPAAQPPEPRAPDAPPADQAPGEDEGEADAAPPPPKRVTVINAADGRPLPGVQVNLGPRFRSTHGYHHAPRWVTGATTGADGLALLPVRVEVDAEAMVFAQKLGFEEARDLFVDGMTVALDPLPPLDGVVVDEKSSPVPRARVTTAHHRLSAVSDGSGRFRLAAPAAVRVYAERDGAFGHGDWFEDKKKEVVVMLRPPTVLRRVVDLAGKPLAGASVAFDLGTIGVHLFTRADGTWAMSRIDADPDVIFSKEGYGTVITRVALGRQPSNVTLIRAGRVEGVVVTPDGRPVAGANVSLVGKKAAAQANEPEVSDSRQAAKTGSDGRFSFGEVGATEIEVSASLDERTGEAKVKMAEGGTAQVKVVLRPVTIDVPLAVSDSRGRLLEMYDWNATATVLPDQSWTSSGSLGSVPLTKGRFRIDVTTDDGPKASVVVEVDPKDEMDPIAITLDGAVEDESGDITPTHSLTVRVRGPTGVPVGGAEVECLYGGGPTREDGSYECTFTPNENAWPLQVRARKGNESGMTRAFGNEKEVEVVIRPSRVIRGRIEGPLPSGKCSMLVNSSIERVEVPVTGRSFVLEGRGPVRTFLCLECKGELESDPHSRQGCAVSEPGQDEVVVQTGAQGTLALKVLDSAGAPVWNPVLYIDRTEQQLDAPEGEVRALVVPGTHVVVINIRGKRERAEHLFTIRPGETTSLGTVQLK